VAGDFASRDSIFFAEARRKKNFCRRSAQIAPDQG
jgi:hypothetical protein